MWDWSKKNLSLNDINDQYFEGKVASVRWVDDHWEFKTDIAVSFGLQSYHSAGCGVLDRRWKKWIVRLSQKSS